MTNDVKTNEKKHKNFLEDILESCQQFFESIIPTFERAFESISSAFESLFFHSSESKDFEGSNENSKASIDSVVEKNTRTRQSIAELLTLKPLNEEQEEKMRKQYAFEEASKKGAINFVNDYLIDNEKKIDEFVASDDEEKVKKIKKYFVDKFKDGNESFDSGEVSQLFDYEVVKSEIINYCKELLREDEEVNEMSCENNFEKREIDVINIFISDKFSGAVENLEEKGDEILLFTLSNNCLKEISIREFVRDKYPKEQFNFKRLTKLASINQSSPFVLDPPVLKMGEGVSPGSTIESPSRDLSNLRGVKSSSNVF